MRQKEDRPKVIKHDLSKPSRKISPSTPPKLKTFGVEFAGEWEVGKTRVASLFPKPAMFDTEDKGYREMEKVGRVDHWYAMHTMQDLRDWVITMVKDPEVQTLIIDSGSDLSDIAAQEYLDETGAEAVFPVVLWNRVYTKVDELIHMIRKSHKYLVVTSRLKDQYIADKRTGRQIRSGYRKFPYQLDMMINFEWGLRTGKGKDIELHYPDRCFGRVIKNSFWKKRHAGKKKPWLFDVSFDGIVKELLEPWPYGHLTPEQKEKQLIEDLEVWIAEQERLDRKARVVA